MSSGCCICCHKPRYMRLVDSLYPPDYNDSDLVIHDLEKLLYLGRSDPQCLDDVGEYLTSRLRRAMVRDRIGHVCVSLKIMDKLLSEVRVQHLSLLAESFLNMVHELLQSNNHFFQNLAANSFVAFSEQSEASPPYHHQYDFCIDRFASMSLMKKDKDESMYRESRLCGIRALMGVVKKIGHEESNLWDSNHLNKIIPAYLFNMKDHIKIMSLEGSADNCYILGDTAEKGLKELVTVASFSRANAILYPVLSHFDLNSLWLDDPQFAINTFVLIIQTMQPQVRYLSIQALLSHLDSKSSNQHRLKRGILEVLSSCVGVATDGSIGPSVLDVFRTLVKHLHNSVEESQVHDQDVFHKTIVRIVGEFAAVLPDYHNPDIMNLIFSYLPLEGDGNIKSINACSAKQAEFISLLVKCLNVVADSSQPSDIDSTLPESLLVSLSQLMDIQQSDVQLDVLHLWQKMMDHNNNKTMVPNDTNWKKLSETGLSLGNAPIRFRHQARKLLFPKIINLANFLYPTLEHASAFYMFVFLISVEFLSAGSNDILLLMVEMENLASELKVTHGNFIHACVSSCLHVVSAVTEDNALASHVERVIEKRKESYSNLLMPAGLACFINECSSEVRFEVNGEVNESSRQNHLFNLVQNGFISYPTEYTRNSSSIREYPVFTDHSRSFRSYSGDHIENDAPNEMFTFENLKDEMGDNGQLQNPTVVEDISPSFEEMIEHVQDSSHKEDIEDILKSAKSMKIDEATTTYDLDLNFL